MSTKRVIKKTRETLLKEVRELKSNLSYYKYLDEKGQVIHDYIKPFHTTAVKLFKEITGNKLDDYKFNKDDKKQARDIRKYNYEVNFQKYCGTLAREYKKLSGLHAQKFKKYNKEEDREEQLEEYTRNHIENEKQEEAIGGNNQSGSIADKTKNTSGCCMYPKKFKNKNGEEIKIIDIAREILNNNPPDKWEENIVLVNPKEIIVCECGCEIQRAGLTRHIKTKKHKNLLNKKN